MFKEFWENLVQIKKVSNRHIIANCPICDEMGGHFYANIETGCWDCKKCQVSGNAWTFLRDHKQLTGSQIFQHLSKYGITNDRYFEPDYQAKPKYFDRQSIDYYCSKLTNEKKAEFAAERGLSIEILNKYRLGINDNGEFTLPIFDAEGNVRNILRKKPGESTISSSGGEGLLFGIDDLIIEEKDIFVVEGPWSALALKERGFKAVGTCGAGILKDEQLTLFKNKNVYIIPDNDKPGKDGAEKIAQKLKAIAESIQFINLPVKEKKDVRDFFKEGGTVKQFEELIKQSLIRKENQSPLKLSDFLKKEIPSVEFYVMDILQKKGKGMVSAAPNIGKSIFVQNMALDMAFGSELFVSKFSVLKCRVLYLDLEMGESSLKERLQKMCNLREGSEELDNLFVKYIPALDLLLEESQRQIESWLEDLKVDVLILDPLGNAWSGDESKQEQVGQLTAYMNTLIAKFGVAILVVHHWRKATKDFKSGGQMAAGSYKWEAWLDSHLTLEGNMTSITVSCHKNRNRPRFNPFLAKINTESLSLEFITDYQKKFDENTLVQIFERLGKEKVSIPELIKYAKEQNLCSETTLRGLIDNSKILAVDKTAKTHYLMRKNETRELFNE